MKTMHVEHKQWIDGTTRYEETNIYAPGISVSPIHTLDRHMSVRSLSDVEAALQSLHFGDIIADKLSKKYGAKGATFKSNVPGAEALYMAMNGGAR